MSNKRTLALAVMGLTALSLSCKKEEPKRVSQPEPMVEHCPQPQPSLRAPPQLPPECAGALLFQNGGAFYIMTSPFDDNRRSRELGVGQVLAAKLGSASLAIATRFGHKIYLDLDEGRTLVMTVPGGFESGGLVVCSSGNGQVTIAGDIKPKVAAEDIPPPPLDLLPTLPGSINAQAEPAPNPFSDGSSSTP